MPAPDSTPSRAAPRVSIALCTYNGERFLCRQLETLSAQTVRELEIVAVDDASVDGTWTLLQEYARGEPRMRVHRNAENLGFTRNFERAIGLCEGEFIAPCDQDDLWHPEKLAILLGAVQGHSAAYCDSQLVDEHEAPLDMTSSATRNMYRGRDPAAFVFSNSVSGHALLFRRTLLDRVVPFPPVRFHDWWLAFAAASFEGIAYVDRPLVKYRQHQASQTDIAKRKDRRSERDGVETFVVREHWLRHLAGLPSAHQDYFRALHREWQALAQGWFSARLLRLLWSRRDALYFINRKARRRPLENMIRAAVGLRLRRLYHPRRYPDVPLPKPAP